MKKPHLSENATKVLDARYLRKDRNRNIIETPEELFSRVAKAVAQAELQLGKPQHAEQWEEIFLNMLLSLDFLPNSPTLMNAGTGLGQLSACFVLPVEDTMEGIFDALKRMAVVQRTGGGTGFSFSKLRPEHDFLSSTGGEASGPVSFMRIFDCATDNIKQGGRRRGANMGVMQVSHPDIRDFIQAKVDESILHNFNISVAVTHDFMEAVRKDAWFDLLHPGTGKASGKIKAKEVFHSIAQAAWQTGDPGLIFLDTINEANPTPHLGNIHATNPCGEIPLLPYESCNLGSINLAHMLKDGQEPKDLDREKLIQTTRYAVRFLDNVIEVNKYPFPEIETITRGNRKIGLGVMGFSEMLIRLGVSYNSPKALSMGEKVMSTIAGEALKVSQELTEVRGTYPNWHGSVHEQRGLKLRNAACTAIAPTGTIGILAGTTPSIEPLFALAYRRSHVLEGRTLYEINPLLQQYLESHHLDPEKLTEQILEKGRLADIQDVPQELKQRFVTALEIPYEQHLAMQSAFQRHVDNSVSKTVNLPEDSTPEDVYRAYWRAWEMGLKGITVYRYGSKSKQVLQLGAEEEPHHYDHASRCDPEECKV
jgi:ribonucleoside-diphosphate reductase alpha chain